MPTKQNPSRPGGGGTHPQPVVHPGGSCTGNYPSGLPVVTPGHYK